MTAPIFSADDFGLTLSVNEAVEIAHTQGVLTQASLMVAAPAAADAVARAKSLPNLHVGLHLVLVDGDSILGHEKLPTITDKTGKFPRNQAALGAKYFFSLKARRELKAEIEAQFAAYTATGLPLHHADAHKHMHLHPTVARIMIATGKAHGVTRIRIPAEPPAILKRCGENPTLADRVLYAWSHLLRFQARGLATTKYVFGLKWSGHMTLPRVRTLLANLPDTQCEIYFHPAIKRDPDLTQLMHDYDHAGELETLVALQPSSSAIAARNSAPVKNQKVEKNT